ncbi:Cyclin-dependent kinase F-4 [Camellia lanceoleosa]|uniref:Cyclin-dependent kinase F-4 n=1 Tax=Camellia lanceoleosa TaxID=1840588 RepID=A0ACC0ICA5_9ERIC|nr:Cyclin-dependent kinase F-4 [Camellia lanceoleosa]
MYNSAVDMWAMGAIMAELFTLRPLFPGSSEADEIYKICSIIGTPNETEWAEGLKLASAINYQFPQLTGVHLSVLMPSASKDAINIITSLCSWDPCKRPTALEALQHPFFQSCILGTSELSLSRFSSCIMLVAYASYLFFQLRCQHKFYGPVDEAPVDEVSNSSTADSPEEEVPAISKWKAIGWHAILTLWVSVLSGYLVDTIQEHRTHGTCLWLLLVSSCFQL